jgi:hypothetical protein
VTARARLRRAGALAAALASATIAQASRADSHEAAWGRAEDLDLARVGRAVIPREPRFVPDARTAEGVSPARAELEGAASFDLGAATPARLHEPRRDGALALVEVENFFDPTRPDVQRFWQENPRDAEPMTASCGRSEPRAEAERSARSWLLAPRGDGTMRLSYRHAWFDFGRCGGALLRAYDVTATPIAGGRAFVWITSCPSCAPGERERLHVAMPAPNELRTNGRVDYRSWVTYGASASIEPGTAATFQFRAENEGVRTFGRLLHRAPETPPFTSIRVDVVRGLEDPLPVVAVFVRPS